MRSFMVEEASCGLGGDVRYGLYGGGSRCGLCGGGARCGLCSRRSEQLSLTPFTMAAPTSGFLQILLCSSEP
ncbi:hypothetical protein F2Q69_00022865 [Brassica cretica]|uniref:Uncharacterized protein n=1 Tax=Brassica cretica TaxID=69181 RepID=A0A8S9Q3Q9_BRACR|nr:hypothetical protein F2Q69_00022865 [Brassica cretica]